MAKIEVNGTRYLVEVQRKTAASKTPVLVREELPVPRSAHKFKKNIGAQTKINAPLPGNIMQIYVKEGDEVKKGDKLIMYEAMKMENIITADRAGTVKKIYVAAGESVLQNDVLLDIV